MRITMVNFGTTGDVQPFIALAVELSRHGHQTALASSPEVAPRAELHGVRFCPLGPDLREIQDRTTKMKLAQPSQQISYEQMLDLLSPVISALPQMFQDLKEICSGADVLICGPDNAIAQMVHEVIKIPLVSIEVVHHGIKVPSETKRLYRSILNPLRSEVGLPPSEDVGVSDAKLTLYALSRYTTILPSDWPPDYHLTGYFFLEEENWRPDPALLDFIDAGDPPVVITFGSVVYEDPVKVSELACEAAQLAGYRAIIQRGWGELARGPLPRNIHAIDFVPYAWLFQRVSCVVHHGGAGTAAEAFRAGVPSVFVPHCDDQFLWASHAYKLGCAVAPIPYAELTAERLAVAIAATVSSAHYGRKAEELGKKIRSEGGVEKARQLIEQLV